MCEFLITSDAPIFEKYEHERYFKAAYDFIVQKVGGEKYIISAVVHLDDYRNRCT